MGPALLGPGALVFEHMAVAYPVRQEFLALDIQCVRARTLRDYVDGQP